MPRLTVEERFWSKVDKTPGHGPWGTCWVWTACVVGGYGQFGLNGKLRYAHQIAWELTHGAIPNRDGCSGTVIRHDCDNRRCCNPAHMQLGTTVDNVRDMDERGRRRTLSGEEHKARHPQESYVRGAAHHSKTRPETVNKGVDHGCAVLTEAQVLDIRRRYAAGGITQRELGAEYGIDQTAVSMIVLRKNWKHI